MNSHHQKAFKELREWCCKYDCFIGVKQQHITFEFKINSVTFQRQSFHGSTESVINLVETFHPIDPQGRAHSISSESEAGGS